MATFESVHVDAIIGKLVTFERMLLKGYLGLSDGAAFERLLNSQHEKMGTDLFSRRIRK